MSAASFFAQSTLVTLEHQKTSAKYFRNFYIAFGVAFLSFAVSTFYTNVFTILANNSLYIFAFYLLKLGFASLNGQNQLLEQKISFEFKALVIAIVIINGFFLTILWSSHILRTFIVLSIATYYCVSCIKFIDNDSSTVGRRTSRLSLMACIGLMIIMLTILAVSGSSFYYISLLMLSQCIVLVLLFGATLVTFLSDASMQYQKEAKTDFLTGMHNRRYLNERLKEIIYTAQRHLTPVAIVLLDIDHFKKINDTYGHEAGDEVLKVVSDLIKSTLRTSDISARYGGEEFCLLLPFTELDGAEFLANRMKELIESAEVNYKGEVIRITASFGIAEVAIDKTPDEAIKKADDALYCSKENGRNLVTVAA